MQKCSRRRDAIGDRLNDLLTDRRLLFHVPIVLSAQPELFKDTVQLRCVILAVDPGERRILGYDLENLSVGGAERKFASLLIENGTGDHLR